MEWETSFYIISIIKSNVKKKLSIIKIHIFFSFIHLYNLLSIDTDIFLVFIVSIKETNLYKETIQYALYNIDAPFVFSNCVQNLKLASE